MAHSLSEDEFERLQNQLIELRTANYGHEEQARRTTAELASLRQKVVQLEKDLDKANKIISKSKKAKDVAAAVEESEALQRKLHQLEEEYQLQNKTLMEELSRLSQENESLKQQQKGSSEEKAVASSEEKDVNEVSAASTVASLEGEIQWLKAVNKTLEKTLQSTKEKHEAQIADLKKSFGLKGRSPLIVRQSKARALSPEADGAVVSSPLGEDAEDKVTEERQGNDEAEPSVEASYQEEIDMLNEEVESLKAQLREKEDLQLKLDALEEERRVSTEKNRINHEKYEKEIRTLQEEVAKLNEKLRKKQEILLQLQDEKEKLYSESKASLTEAMAAKEREIQVLIEQAAKVQEELDKTNQSYQEMQQRNQSTIKELQSSKAAVENQARGSTEESGRLILELQQRNDGLSSEIASLKDELQKGKTLENEALVQSSQFQKSAEGLEKTNVGLREKIENLQAQIQQLERARKQLADEKELGQEEKQQALVQLDETLRLAEKRKVIADDASRERAATVAEHQRKLDEMKREYEESCRKLNESVEAERAKAESCAARLKKLDANEKELEETRVQVGELESKVQMLQDGVETVKREGEESLKKAIVELKELESELESARREKEEIEEKLSSQEQVLLDKDEERKLGEKKSAALIKDLKRQLQLERKRAEKMKEQVSETKGKQSLDELFVPPSDAHRPPSRESSSSSATGTGPGSGHLVASSASSLPDDTAELLARLTEMRQENWRLEERVAHLETNASSLAEDVLQKSAIIQQHYMDSKSRVSDWAHSPKQQQRSASQRMLSSLMSPFKTAKGLDQQQNLKEAVSKLQRVVEETLMKNIHLQQNIDMLVGEIAKLQEENNRLLAGLGSDKD